MGGEVERRSSPLSETARRSVSRSRHITSCKCVLEPPPEPSHTRPLPIHHAGGTAADAVENAHLQRARGNGGGEGGGSSNTAMAATARMARAAARASARGGSGGDRGDIDVDAVSASASASASALAAASASIYLRQAAQRSSRCT